jgi:hypothetical protein
VKNIVKACCFLLFIYQFSSSQAQKPNEWLMKLAYRAPIEKVYLHLDRDNYVAGETAWFKAYLQSNSLPDTISSVLYVELLSSSSSVLVRKVLPVLLGVTNGQIELPDSLVTGNYILTAYTPTMLRYGADFIFKKMLFIYGKKPQQRLNIASGSVKLDFFPEGGNLVSGFNHTIAFKATDEKGLPVQVSGQVMSSRNQHITTFSSFHDGMGLLNLTPLAGESYFAVLDNSGEKFNLPAAKADGISFTVIPHPQGSFFEIIHDKKKINYKAAYILGQMQHQLVFKNEFAGDRDEIQGVIDTKNLNSGILQLTVFNKNDLPLAERLVFVNNGEYIQHAEVYADTLNFSPKGKNRFSIRLKDTVQGSLSVSVTDAAYLAYTSRNENIYSHLLFTADLKGYIHQPAYYFSSVADSVAMATDLVMMTNGWRRFDWKEMNQEAGKSPEIKDPSFITLTGRATFRDSKKPFDNKPLLLLIINADSTRSAQITITDKKGNFRIDSLILFGKARIFFSDTRGKKSSFIDVELTGDSINRSYAILKGQENLLQLNDVSANSLHHLAIDYDALLREKGKMLEEVTINVKMKTPLQWLEEKYAKGAFEGGDAKTFDLVNTDDRITYTSIFDYLDAKGVRPGRRNMPTLSSLGAYTIDFYLDEIPVDADVIETVPFYQVALIKVYNTFTGGWGGTPGGAVAVYTKKGEDLWSSMPAFGRLLSYNGFSIIKEFYAPDYLVTPIAKNKPDNRITLDWRPSIFINNINPKIPLTFFNSNRTKSFYVIVEGITTSGKMICIEKTFSKENYIK